MTKLEWNRLGERLYQTGVDHGVLFVDGAPVGIPWNGLIGLSSRATGADRQAKYIDGVKVSEETNLEEFQATLEAYTYPPEFAECDGTIYESSSLIHIGMQPRKSFGLAYRTRVGNDVNGTEYGYQIHLIYGATAAPTAKGFRTVSNNTDPVKMSWDLSTLPVAVDGYLPTAHLVFDSTQLYQSVLVQLESIIFGTEVSDSRLPTPQEIIDIVGSYLPMVLYRSNLMYQTMTKSDNTGAALVLGTGVTRTFVQTEEYDYHRYTLPAGYTRTGDFFRIAAANWGGVTALSTWPVIPGKEYTMGIKLRSDQSLKFRLDPQSLNSAGTGGTAATILDRTDWLTMDGYWQQLFVTFRVPATGMAALRFDLDTLNIALTEAAVVDMTEAILVEGTELPPIFPPSDYYVHEVLGVRDPRIPGDLVEIADGLYQRSVFSRLTETAVDGLYTLEG